MKSWAVWFIFLLLLVAAVPVYAGMGNTIALVGQGAVELPISVLKIVGGTFKLVGETLTLPFRIF